MYCNDSRPGFVLAVYQSLLVVLPRYSISIGTRLSASMYKYFDLIFVTAITVIILHNSTVRAIVCS